MKWPKLPPSKGITRPDQLWPNLPPSKGITRPDLDKFEITGSTHWYSEPFSSEEFDSNRHYRSFALEHFPRHVIARALLKHEKALSKKNQTRYRRPEAIAKVARRMHMDADRVANLENRSNRHVYKRRKIVSK